MERPERPFYLRRRVLLPVVTTAAGLWFISLSAVLIWGLQDDARKADAIIVMGAAQYRGKPSPVLRARLDHAVMLWNHGLAPRVVLTGGIAETPPAQRMISDISRIVWMHETAVPPSQ